MQNIVQFPNPNSDRFGAVHSKRLHIQCNDCGNTERFYGTAYTQPFIVVEKQSEHQYDVAEIGYRNNGSIDEIIESCAACGSKNITIDVLQKGFQK